MLIKSLTKVDKLTERVEKFYDDKQAEEELQARLQARTKLINEAPKFTKTDFWCHHHEEDLLGCLAYKVVQKDWAYPYQKVAFYEAYKACCKGLRRRITDKDTDPYFTKSKMLRQQRQDAIARGDLLQPNDYGFKMKYGDVNKKLYDKLDKEERANWQKKITILK